MTDKKSYRELSTQLNELLDSLQDSDLDIDEATKLYQEGVKLIAQMEARLEAVENTIKQIKDS